MDIQNDRKMLLEKTRKKGPISPSDLYKKDDTVNETFGSERTVQRGLKELVNEHGYLKRQKEGRKMLYEISSKGRNYLQKVKKRERQKKDEDEIFDYQDGYDHFVKYFESKDYGYNQIEKASIGRNYVYLDYQNLEKFHHELADDLLSDPDRVLSAAKNAVRDMPEVQDDVDVRIKNVSDIERQAISDLSSRDINNLVTVEGVIQSVSGVGSQIESAIFECTACGDRYEKEQETTKLKSPYKCDCGNKKFDVIREKHKTVRFLNIKEKPDQRSRDKIVAVIKGDLAEDESKNLKAIGSAVKVVGYLDTYLKKKNDDFQSFRLVANNIEVEESKWEREELSVEEEKQIHELSKSENIESKLVESLAYEEIKGLDLLKEAFIVFLLGKDSKFGNVHMLCTGDPGTGKSHLAKYVAENSNRVLKSVATGATEVGLTAAVVKDEMTGEWTAEAGALAMADEGFHITDEVDELDDKHYSAYNEALSDESISLAKAGINTELSADVSEFALGNPSPHYSFDDHTPKIEQVPVDKDDLISRFGIMLAVEDDNSTDEKMEKVEHIIKRNDLSNFEDDEFIDKDVLFKYIHYAQRISPSMSSEAEDKILDACRELFDDSSEDRIKLRHAEALASISSAYAKMHLDEVVRSDHVESAFDFFRRCYRSLGFDIGKDDFNSIDSVNNRQLSKVRSVVESIEGDSGADYEDVVEESSFDEQIVNDVVEKLKNEGNLFEPESGKVKTI